MQGGTEAMTIDENILLFRALLITIIALCWISIGCVVVGIVQWWVRRKP